MAENSNFINFNIGDTRHIGRVDRLPGRTLRGASSVRMWRAIDEVHGPRDCQQSLFTFAAVLSVQRVDEAVPLRSAAEF